jgi:hypothetical protein
MNNQPTALETTPEPSDILNLAQKEITVRDVRLPYTVKNHIIFSSGTHNNMFYSRELIMRAFKETNWDKQARSLFLDHADQKSSEWVGYVDNLNIDSSGTITADLEVWDLSTAIKLMGGAKFGISPSFKGRTDGNTNIIHEGYFKNFSIVPNPAVKTTYLNAEDAKPFEEFEVKFENEEVKKTMPEDTPPPATPKKEADDKEKEKMMEELKTLKEQVATLIEAKKNEPKKEEYPAPKMTEKYPTPEEKEKTPEEEEKNNKKMQELEAKIQLLEEAAKQKTSPTEPPQNGGYVDVDKGMLNVLRSMDGLPPVD